VGIGEALSSRARAPRNSGNNSAQKNFWIEYSSHSSPYDHVDFEFSAANPIEEKATLVYFRAEGFPRVGIRR
jgi:hypothetical protein